MTAAPRILAFDTSAAHCAAALLSEGEIVAARVEAMAKGQAERLMPLLEEVLADARLGWGELDALGVGTGPGNFTGVRIAVAAARGLSLSLGIPAVGVTGFEAVRQRVGAEEDPLIVTLDTQRGGLAWQAFAAGAPDGPPRFAATEEEIADERFEGRPPGVVGPRAMALAMRLAAGARGGSVAARDAEASGGPAFDAADIARVAAVRLRSGGPIPRPAPVYVRPADALPPREAPPRVLP